LRDLTIDQGHFLTKLDVPRLICHGQESNPGLLSGRQALKKRAIETAPLIAIQISTMAAPVYLAVTHGLILGAQAQM
jgi:hypothetical protein